MSNVVESQGHTDSHLLEVELQASETKSVFYICLCRFVVIGFLGQISGLVFLCKMLLLLRILR